MRMTPNISTHQCGFRMMAANRSEGRGASSPSRCTANASPLSPMILVFEWQRTASGFASSTATHFARYSGSMRSSCDAHLKYSPVARRAQRLWFGPAPML